MIFRVKYQTGRSVKVFRNDNGTEYDNQRVRHVFASYGIQHEFSAPYVKQCNGMAE